MLRLTTIGLLCLMSACSGGRGGQAVDAGLPFDSAIPDSGGFVDGSPGARCGVDVDGWTSSLVHDGPGKNEIRLALGPGGTPTFAWVGEHSNLTGYDVLYVTRPNGDGYETENLAGDPTGVKGVDLVVDDGGTVYVVYGIYRTFQHTILAWSTPEGWQEAELAGDRATSFSSLAITSDGTPWVIYTQQIPLTLGYRDGEMWTWETIDDGRSDTGLRSVGLHNAMTLDADGTAHISYTTFSENALYYATGRLGAWEKHRVRESVRRDDTSIAVGADGTVHIAYADDEGISIAYGAPSGWSSMRVTGNHGARGVRLVLLPDGSRHVFYGDGTRLHWAREEDGAFEALPFATSASATFDLTMDSEGALHVAWLGGSREICHATRRPGS